MSIIRVGIICDYFHPSTGGMENLVLSLAKGLAKRGIEVYVFASWLPGQEKEYDLVKGVHVKKLFTHLSLHKKAQHLLVVDPILALRFTGLIKDLKLDLLHSHSLLSPSAIIAARKANVPIVVTIHDYWCVSCFRRDLLFQGSKICSGVENCSKCIFNSGLFGGLINKYRQFYTSIVKKATVLTSVSKATKKIMVNNGFNPHQITVINNFIEYRPKKGENIFRKTYNIGDSKMVLYVGQMISAKGPQILLQSAYLLLKEKINIKFIFVGKGKILSNLMNNLKKESNNLVFLGYLSNNLLQQAYSEADICVVPSMWQEPFGIVALEAMKNEKPVIASRIGGLEESVIDNETGILVEPGNTLELAKALFRLSRNDDERAKMGAKGKRYSEKIFNTNLIFKQYIALYNRLMA